jgi:hypothetical protein
VCWRWALALSCTGLACQPRIPDLGPTPEDWESFALNSPPCVIASVDSAQLNNEVQLPLSAGSIMLPARFQASMVRERNMSRLFAPDSSFIEMSVDADPTSAMASSRRIRITRTTCSLPVAGRAAWTALLTITDTLTQRVTYAAVINAFPKPRFALNTYLQTQDSISRDVLVAAVHRLTLRSR